MVKKATVTNRTLRHSLLQELLEEQVGNLTQDWRGARKHRQVWNHLAAFARKTVYLSISNGFVVAELGETDWKKIFGNKVYDRMMGNSLEELIEQSRNALHAQFPKAVITGNITKVSFWKIAQYAGLVSQLIFQGHDPLLLTMTEEEFRQHARKEIIERAIHNQPTFVYPPSERAALLGLGM